MNILKFHQVDSTNTIAKEMAMNNASAGRSGAAGATDATEVSDAARRSGASLHGTVIMAEEQLAGYGRLGRSFFSPPGHGIYMSLIVDPDRLGLSAPTIITVYAAVAVCEAIESLCGKKPQIKWVNDIFLGEKKICGISAETVMDSKGKINWIVVGIGVNFTLPAVPNELAPIIGAIYEGLSQAETTREQLANKIINKMLNPQLDGHIERYKRRLFILGKKIRVEGTDNPYEAIALDVDNAGQLLVKNESGEIITLTAGEISIRTCLK